MKYREQDFSPKLRSLAGYIRLALSAADQKDDC